MIGLSLWKLRAALKELEENMIVDMVERRDNSKGWVTLETDK